MSEGTSSALKLRLNPRSSLGSAITRAHSNLDLSPEGVANGVPPTPSVEWFSASALEPGGGGQDGEAASGAGAGPLLATCVLWLPAWDQDALVRLRNQLGSRPLVAVEPVAGLGLRRLVQWLLTPWWRHQLGHDFNRDLPIELRAAGFTVDTIDRFTAGRLAIKTYAYLELSSHP
ncbi:MAG: hypothetical protein GY724_23340 [Actinomycetia bacterium]|nr:hypothetical protein [Actinomycetes bacterium]MCP4222346.1 hypothetical protein [Actinomycetes bacterium]MCP5032373.1 hypothetical protein [Actinomycetes bacterium]